MTKKKRPPAKHPIQPLVETESGVIRFKANAIVQYLLDNGGIDLNALARMEFSQEDREQFAQLIGYSHSGSGDLGYVSDEVWCTAKHIYDEGVPELEARNQVLRDQMEEAREGMRQGVASLFHIHPDDLTRS